MLYSEKGSFRISISTTLERNTLHDLNANNQMPICYAHGLVCTLTAQCRLVHDLRNKGHPGASSLETV